ncbi:GNAT family N-acetyltransferase [Paenibacillus bouchesdurhonensis]|uniref:GNAT family N-acetyltransferase n=1 Tax=Paenibacillus bouchesdurhonensis TaxID=1870990 RepID=UPI000DA5F4D5|nr:GNAT family N-acetyltransferase [Paenibacillus bouchesdurhonensis]
MNNQVWDEINTQYGTFAIALANASDKAIVREMLIEAAVWMAGLGVQQWNPEQFTTDEIDQYFAEREIYLLIRENKPVGMFTLQSSDPEYWGALNEEGFSYLHRLTVRSAWRGKQLGGAMIEWAAKRTKQLNRKALRLDCWDGNIKLNRMYESMGFALKGSGKKQGRGYNLYEMNINTQ